MSQRHQKKYELAKRLIAKHGRSITLVVKGKPLDPEKPWLGIGDDVLIENIMAVFVPYQGSGFGETLESGGLLTGAKDVCLLTVPPEVDIGDVDSIIDQGRSLGIEWREVLKPGEVRIIIGLGVNL